MLAAPVKGLCHPLPGRTASAVGHKNEVGCLAKVDAYVAKGTGLGSTNELARHAASRAPRRAGGNRCCSA